MPPSAFGRVRIFIEICGDVSAHTKIKNSLCNLFKRQEGIGTGSACKIDQPEECVPFESIASPKPQDHRDAPACKISPQRPQQECALASAISARLGVI